MNTLETDIEIGADGSVRLLSPLPAWLKPGRAHMFMTVEPLPELEKPKRQKLTCHARDDRTTRGGAAGIDPRL